MKRILSSIVLVAFLLLASNAFAGTQLKDTKYLLINKNTTKARTAIPTTVIDPTKHRIIRFKVGPIWPADNGTAGGTHTEVWAQLFDAASVGAATDKVSEGEIESNDADPAEEKYTNPLIIQNGIVMDQGAQTAVLIEWEYRY